MRVTRADLWCAGISLTAFLTIGYAWLASLPS